MNRISLLLIAILAGSAHAAEKATSDIDNELKKAGNSVGEGMSQAGKAIAPEVRKFEDWLGNSTKNAGKKADKQKTDKAGK